MKQYTVKVFNDHTEWFNSAGKLDREDGPAVEYYNGDYNGDKEWFKEGQLHREDGPACEFANGTKYWYLEGKRYTKADFLEMTSKTITCEGKVVEIDGKKYSLTLLDK